jgi:hypothetical protein
MSVQDRARWRREQRQTHKVLPVSTADTLITAAAGVAGAAVGGFGSFLATRSQWKRTESTALLPELSGLFDLVMGRGDYTTALRRLTEVRLRLAALGVPEEMVAELHDSVLRCWTVVQEIIESHDYIDRSDIAPSVADMERYRPSIRSPVPSAEMPVTQNVANRRKYCELP